MGDKSVVQPEGNYYNKYSSKNPIERRLMNGFFASFNRLLKKSGFTEKKGGELLDAGCGEGYMYNVIKQSNENFVYTAFDISENLIKKNISQYPDIRFFTHNIYERLEEAVIHNDKKYDLVVCSEVLEHLEYPENAIHNLMNYGNSFIFSVPNEPIWRILNMVRGKYLKSFGNTPGHIQHFSEREFSKLLNRCGLEMVCIEKPLPWLMIYASKKEKN